MTPQAALIELLARVGTRNGAAVLVSAEELSQWPAAAVAAMKSQKLLAKARPAASVVCPGCERECVMPVHTLAAGPRGSASFIVCDKRSDINRVAVDILRLEQWQATGALLANTVARLLDMSPTASTADNDQQWNIGVLKGKRQKSLVTLRADGDLTLSLAGHAIPLAEVLAIERDALTVDKGELIRLVDKPAGNAKTETPEQRRERLTARVQSEKSKGTRAFLLLVAEEEGISVSRLKQITAAGRPPVNKWAGLTSAQKKGAGSKKIKPKH